MTRVGFDLVSGRRRTKLQRMKGVRECELAQYHASSLIVRLSEFEYMCFI